MHRPCRPKSRSLGLPTVVCLCISLPMLFTARPISGDSGWTLTGAPEGAAPRSTSTAAPSWGAPSSGRLQDEIDTCLRRVLELQPEFTAEGWVAATGAFNEQQQREYAAALHEAGFP
jgi:hypothetical protein